MTTLPGDVTQVTNLSDEQLQPCTCHPLHRRWLHTLPPQTKDGGQLCSLAGCAKCQGFRKAE